MLNPAAFFLVGLVLVIVAAFASIPMGILTANELWLRFKDLLVILIPLAIGITTFAFSQRKNKKVNE